MHDDIRNLERRDTLVGSWPNLSYKYGEHGAGPHAVTHVNSGAYWYDRAGNQIMGPSRRIRYKAFNLPSTIREGGTRTSFEYDATHSRAVKRHVNAETVYVGGLYEHRVKNGRTIQVFYVPGAGHLVAQIEQWLVPTNYKPLFLHHDQLGSIVMVTNETGNVVGRAGYGRLGSLWIRRIRPYFFHRQLVA